MPQQNLDLGQQVQRGFDSFVNEQIPNIIDYNKQIYPQINDALYRGAEYSYGELEKTYDKVLNFLQQFYHGPPTYKLSAEQNAVVDPTTGKVEYADSLPDGMKFVDPQQIAGAEMAALPYGMALPYAGYGGGTGYNPGTYSPYGPDLVYGGNGAIDPRMQMQPGLSYGYPEQQGPRYAPSGWEETTGSNQRYAQPSQAEYYPQQGLGGTYQGQPYQAYGPSGYGYNQLTGYWNGNSQPGYGLAANSPYNQYADIPFYASGGSGLGPGGSNYVVSGPQQSNYVTSGEYA